MFTNGGRRSRTQLEREHILLLLDITRRYWVDGQSQAEIAREVGYSRPSISRLLAEARERRMVTIKVGHPLERVLELESQLQQRYGLRLARVANDFGGLDSQVGRCAADVLCERLRPGDVVSVSNGRAVAATVAEMPYLNMPTTRTVQLIGSDGNSDVLIDAPQTCRNLALKVGGQYSTLPVPLVMRTKAIADAMWADVQVANTVELAARADLALIGVGAVIGGRSGTIFEAYETQGLRLDLSKTPAVGHICGHHFDIEGRHVTTPICGRTMAVDLEHIRKVGFVVGVAYGRDKVTALRGALAGGYLSALVTDRSTALALLDAASPQRGGNRDRQ